MASFKTKRPDATLEDLAFDYQLIAREIRDSRKNAKKRYILADRLAAAIIRVELVDSIETSSALTITLIDPDFELIEFFDIDDNGKIDLIDINYPENTSNWWRMTQFGASTVSGGALELELTFMERPPVLLQKLHGPKKMSRAKHTRAEFFKSLVEDVKVHPLKFVSKELHVVQEIIGSHDDLVEVPRKGVPGSDLAYPLGAHGTAGGGVSDHMSRPFGNWQSDNAIDILVQRGTAVYAVDDGTITNLGGHWDGTGASNPNGYNVTLETSDNTWFYTHLRKREPLTIGETVRAGDRFGESGAANSVNHLHIASEHGDPEQLLKV